MYDDVIDVEGAKHISIRTTRTPPLETTFRLADAGAVHLNLLCDRERQFLVKHRDTTTQILELRGVNLQMDNVKRDQISVQFYKL